VDIILAVLLYPGLALALVLALACDWLLHGRPRLSSIQVPRFWQSLAGLLAIVSIMLAAFGLALLPWPLHPAGGWAWVGQPVAVGAALEGAFLLPVLPGLLALAPLGARATSRESQISIAGRCLVWLALGAALWGGGSWAAAELPGRLLLGLAGLLAIPAAIGAGPFAAERSLSPAAAEEGLDEMTTPLVRFARTVRGAVLLAALVVASVPPAVNQASVASGLRLQPPIALLLIAALFLVAALLIRQVSAFTPRLTLPAGLRWCWRLVLPIAVVGMIYLALI
jgi:hypothetical protein